MTDDPKRVVASGYDAVAGRYLERCGLRPSQAKSERLEKLLGLLAPGSAVLELGCGAGVPVTRALAARCAVTAVDISPVQVALARRYVPGATIAQADMTQLAFLPESFDAVVGFYVFVHVPRTEQPAMLRKIASWLRPGGLFFANMGVSDWPGAVEKDWLGVPMFFSHFDAETNRQLVQQVGFEVVEATEATEPGVCLGKTERFLWVVGRKPADQGVMRPSASAGASHLNHLME